MEHTICQHCGWEVDLETCWCGDGRSDHFEHNFVPMGCTCGYHNAENRKNPLYFKDEN